MAGGGSAFWGVLHKEGEKAFENFGCGLDCLACCAGRVLRINAGGLAVVRACAASYRSKFLQFGEGRREIYNYLHDNVSYWKIMVYIDTSKTILIGNVGNEYFVLDILQTTLQICVSHECTLLISRASDTCEVCGWEQTRTIHDLKGAKNDATEF